MLSQAWAELTEFVRRLTVSGERMRSQERRLEALENGLRDLWGVPTIGGGFSIGGIKGTITGCSSLPLANIIVTAYDPATNIQLDSATTDSSGNYALTVAFRGSSATLGMTIGQPGTDTYQRTTPTNSSSAVTVHAGGTSTVSTTLSAATGYHCLPGVAFPVLDSLTVVDPQQGTGTAVFGAAPIPPGFTAWTYDYGAVTIPSSTGCAGAAASRFVVSLTQSAAGIVWQYHFIGVPGTCPATGSTITGGVSQAITPTVATQPTGTTLLDVSYPLSAGSANSQLFYGGGAVSIRFHE